MEHLTDSRKATNWCVYMHENRFNGKKYIGITSQKPTLRWMNGRGYKECARFFSAIQHYGWDGFKHEILYTCLTQDEAERIEIDLIAKYGTTESDKGYNIEPGGRVNRHDNPATREKLREMRLGSKNPMWRKDVSEETREKLHVCQTGQTRSPETRRRIGESKKGSKNYNARRVLCVETGDEYGSLTEAADAVGVDKSTVYKACAHIGRSKTAGGYHWRYADEAVTVDG